jgi:hypothetical protein
LVKTVIEGDAEIAEVEKRAEKLIGARARVRHMPEDAWEKRQLSQVTGLDKVKSA